MKRNSENNIEKFEKNLEKKTFFSQKKNNQTPDYDIYKKFFCEKECKEYYDWLLKNIEWKKDTLKIFGKEVLEPRMTAWYGEKAYEHTELKEIKEKVEKHLGEEFNSVLLNLYKDGNDYIGWHSDSVPMLGKNPKIASLTFGAEREFQFRLKKDHKIKRNILLENGTLLLMKGDTQELWHHQIPKKKSIISPRINLTFRQVIEIKK